MSEEDVSRDLADELKPLVYDDTKIDDFEKLYAITSAKLNAASMFDDGAYELDDFDEICNFAQYKLEHPEFFEGSTRQATQKDTNFYMIPIHIKMGEAKIKCTAQVDINGNGLYIILPDGRAIPSTELLQLTDIAVLLDELALTDNEVTELLKSGQKINEIAKMIENDELDIELIKEKARAIVRAKGLEPDEIIKEARERDLAKDKIEEKEESQEQSKDDENPEKSEEQLEQEAEEEAERAGVSFDIVQKIAEKKGCKVHQIRYRELYRPDIIKERIGKDLKQYRGRLGIIRITYGFKEEMLIVDKTNGDIIHDDRKHDHELEELVPKWPYSTKMPIKKDEGRSYISYIDESGNQKETKYLNNGKYIDMAKDERERFIVEVASVNKELSDAIKQYEKNNSMENWQKVRVAMAKRVAIDHKYDVLRNQKAVTAKTLSTALALTIGDVGAPKGVREREKAKLEREAQEGKEHELSYRTGDPRWDF